MAKYTNRYNDIYTFSMNKDKSIEWEGPFEYYREGADDSGNTIMVDPSGGPFLEKGKMLSHIVWDEDFNVIIEKFVKTEKGFTIITKPHEYDPNDMSHLADTKIIGGIINTSYDE